MAAAHVVLALLALANATAHAWRVGASSASVLPTVGGRVDYWAAAAPADTDADALGTFVPAFDVGRVPVGNGMPQSHWVRDDVRTYALAIAEDASSSNSGGGVDNGADNGTVLVISSSELYMFHNPDVRAYEELVRARAGPALAPRLRFFVHAQHNHEGPDTSGMTTPINRAYFEYLLETMATVALEAIARLEPADLTFGERQWGFGQGDKRDPVIVDRTLHVLRARPAGQPRAAPIATLVHWTMHPQVTRETVFPVPDDQCRALGREPGCSPYKEFLTGDFPGILRRVLRELDGSGEVIYVNGAIGSQVGPNGPVWEVSDAFPITGDGTVPPPGTTILPRNFRHAFLIGQQLAIAVVGTPSPNAIPTGPIDFRTSYSYSYVTNPLVRIGTCAQGPHAPDVPMMIGYRMRDAYNCFGEPSDATCESDEWACDIVDFPGNAGFDDRGEIPKSVYVMQTPGGGGGADDPTGASMEGHSNVDMHLHIHCHHDANGNIICRDRAPKPPVTLPQRRGNYLRLYVSYAKLGPLRMVALPGEFSPELVIGVPTDFDNPASVHTYFTHPHLHPTGTRYTFPGTLASMLNCTAAAPCYELGLTGDELGYVLPMCDWQLYCHGFEEDCRADYEKGAMTYPMAMSADACDAVVRDIDAARQHYTERFGLETATRVLHACFYGQNMFETQDHYEESNSIGWHAAADFFKTVSKMLDIPIRGRYQLPRSP